jgi:hypothetical protein
MANRPKTTTPLLGQNQNRKSYDYLDEEAAIYSSVTEGEYDVSKLKQLCTFTGRRRSIVGGNQWNIGKGNFGLYPFTAILIKRMAQ